MLKTDQRHIDAINSLIPQAEEVADKLFSDSLNEWDVCFLATMDALAKDAGLR